MIICVKNISVEGPGTLGTFFQKKGYQTREIDLQAGERLSSSFDSVDAVVILGGPMNVYEEDKHPFLKDEDVFIKKILERHIPFLGICLGSQLLAKASGGRVVRSPKEEIGFSSIRLTEDGKKDPLFEGLKETVEIFQWHGDMFEIPPQGKLLASSQDCPHQALKVGACAYGFQFHIEITDKSIREWSQEYWKDKPELTAKKKAMLEDYQKKKAQFIQVADKIYDNFLKIMVARNNAKTYAKER